MEELIDVLNSDGEKTGEIKVKSKIHKDGNWHRIIHVWLINSKNELLIQRRSELMEKYPNYWDITVGGHILAGEDSITSALREVEEEIGINLRPENFHFIGGFISSTILNNDTYFNNEFHDVYLVKSDLNILELKKQESEIDDLKWIPLEELKQWVKEKKEDLVPHPEEYKLVFSYLENN